MREILFKANRLDNGEWVEGFPVYDHADCSLKRQGKCQCAHDGSLITFFGFVDDLHEYDEIEVDPSTVCQYTGLTDRNGKKIFEGDKITMIFSHGQRTANVVGFRGGSFGLHWKRGGVGHFAAFTGICHVEYEVTGSIHDKEEEGRDHDTAESSEGL